MEPSTEVRCIGFVLTEQGGNEKIISGQMCAAATQVAATPCDSEAAVHRLRQIGGYSLPMHVTKSPGALLAQLFETQSAIDSSGREVCLIANISPAFSSALTRVVRENKVMCAVEVGLAYGTSALSILEGLGVGGKLISLDPFHEQLGRVGKILIDQSTRAADHELIELPDYLGLPHLIERGVVADLVYIDGMHTFDYVALDAFYADKLIKPGGIIAFNDCGFRSIHKFLKYFVSHRHYEELNVGLRPDFKGRNPLVTLARTIERRSNQDRYFRKLDDWEPEHNFFKSF